MPGKENSPLTSNAGRKDFLRSHLMLGKNFLHLQSYSSSHSHSKASEGALQNIQNL